MEMPTSGDSGVPDTALFAQALAALKRRGSSVLVAGNTHNGTQLDACRRLLGDATAGPRHRVLVAAGSGIDVDQRLPADEPRNGSVTLVDREIKTRSATASQPSGSTGSIGPVATQAVDGEGLVALGEAISGAVSGIDARESPEPSELRVCIDSIEPLLSDHDEREVFDFLHAFGGEVRRVNAMGHAHLSAEYDTEVVSTLAPAFDAVIELRTRDEEAQQRWHLQNESITTDWLAL